MARPLLALALLAYPRDFRAAYRAQFFMDLHDRDGEQNYGVRLAFDVMMTGLLMRLDLFWRDLTYALRTLRRAPVFTAVVVGTLAVAIAANAVIFSALDAVLLQPLPFPHADRLAMVSLDYGGTGYSTHEGLPLGGFMNAANHSPLIASAAAVGSDNTQMRIDGRVTTADQAFVTSTYFDTLGVKPYVGQFFHGASAAHQAVISYAMWKSKYGGDPSIIGNLLRINDDAYTIVGIAPPSIMDPDYGAVNQATFYILMPPFKPGQFMMGNPIIRLRDGVSFSAVDAEFARLLSTNAIQLPPMMMSRGLKGMPTRGGLMRISVTVHAPVGAPARPQGGAVAARPDALPLAPSGTLKPGLHADPMRNAILSDMTSLWIVFGAAALLLLIACANIANLMLTRAAARRYEYGIRAALGATLRRIFAQTLTETLILAGSGALLGLGIAAVCLHPIIALIPGNIPRVNAAHIDLNVVLYVCALAIGVTLLAGVLPALRAGAKNFTLTRVPRTASVLVALEVAAAFTLLVCSALLLRSFVTMTTQSLGFNPRHGYMAMFAPQQSKLSGPIQLTDLQFVAQKVLTRIRQLPGVTATALTTHPPFTKAFMILAETTFWAQGQPKPGVNDQSHFASMVQLSIEYPQIAGMHVLQGRGFLPADVHNGREVLVNQSFVQNFLHVKNAVGRHIFDGQGHAQQIVGVLEDARDSLTSDPMPTVYYPITGKTTLPFFEAFVRTQADDPHLATEISNLALQIYPRFQIVPVDSLEQAVYDAAAQARAAFFLLAGFTIIAILLALAGIYGVVAFSVERRYHEIGVRLALGATNTGTLRGIVSNALVQTAFGILGGLIVAAFAVQALESELFKIAPFDPASFIGAILLLLACTIIAAAIPGWRALRIDPSRTLRYE